MTTVSTGFAEDGRALEWFLREQALQKGPHILSEGLLDDRGKLLTPPTDRAKDQLRQPRVTGTSIFSRKKEHRHSARR